MPSSKTQRWLDLLALLVGRRVPIPIDEIMEGVPAYRSRWAEGDETARASVRRMFERDKDELRRMGIPLETRPFREEGRAEAEGYLILKRDFYLPYLELLSEGEEPAGATSPSASSHSIGRVTLTEADARVAVVALREVLSLPSFPFQREARTALRKLTFDLDPALAETEEGEPLGPVLRILDRPGGADPSGSLDVLLNALYDLRRVRFVYHSIGRDAVENREVEPWGLLFQWGAWYLAAHDPAKAEEGPDVRLFRVDRMTETGLARARRGGPDFEVPAEFDVRTFAGRKPWELKEDEPEVEVMVRFFPPASLLAARNGWGALLQEGEDGTALRRFSVRRLDPFVRWILSLAGEAEVVSPPEAAERLAEEARSVLALYREEA